MGKNVIVENENKINLDWFVFEPTDFGICGYRRQSFSHADIRPYCRGDKVTVDLYYWTSETARYPEGTQRKVRYQRCFET